MKALTLAIIALSLGILIVAVWIFVGTQESVIVAIISWMGFQVVLSYDEKQSRKHTVHQHFHHE